jgi:hypothetical protein
MAIGKAINKKSFYGSEGGGDIAMPPLNQTPAITHAAPDPWQQQQMQQPQDNPFGPVPDQLPQEVIQEMDAQEQESSDEEPVRDEMSHTEESTHEETSRRVTRDDNKPSPQESFKAVRDAKERAERERDAILSQMLEMQQRMQSLQQQPKQEEQPVEDYDFDIDADALAEGKHLKKLVARQKAMEQQLNRYKAQSEEVAVETRIRNQYPDFEKVVSKENVDILNERFPEIAKTLRDTPDIFNKAAAAYSVIKNFGIHKDALPKDNDRARTIANAQKPRPLTSVNPTQGDSPLSKANAFANGMTDELKDQLRKEMYAARKSM